MATVVGPQGPVTAPAPEKPALAELDALLEERKAGGLKLMDAEGRQVNLPETASCLLHEVVHALARDRAVAVVSLHRDLTTQQAADLLDVSRPYLIRLLEEGEIPSTKTGTHRRVRFDDVMAYKARRDARRREALAELTRLSQEWGLYDGEDHES